MKNLIYITAPDRKKKKQHSDIYLSEKLASLGIIGAQLRASLKLIECSVMYGGFQALNWAFMMPIKTPEIQKISCT